MNEVTVIGGGLAGVEAAWQAANLGAHVCLYEMRPVLQTPAHRTDKLAEIVCSNSLKSDEPGTAPYLLKEELRRCGSLLLRLADRTAVPGGAALAVDRLRFAEPPHLTGSEIEIVLTNGLAEQRHTATVLPHDPNATLIPIRLVA